MKLRLIWGSLSHSGVFVLVCCAFCMLSNVFLMFLEDLDTHLVKARGGGRSRTLYATPPSPPPPGFER